MTLTLLQLFDQARSDLDREKRRLDALVRSAARQSGRLDADGFLAMGRALSFVVMGGVLEAFMRDLPGAISAEISSHQIERRHVPVSLTAALEAAEFRRCAHDGVAAVIARTGIARTISEHAYDSRNVPDISELVKFADGSTISEKHFSAIWNLLGLEGEWPNDANDKLLLREIRAKRNDVAHWLTDPVEVGRRKQPSDLIDMLGRLTALFDHVQSAMTRWIDSCTNPLTVAVP